MIDRSHGGYIMPYAKRLIDFSANINSLGMPHKAEDYIIKNINRVAHYPEPDSKSLKKALGGFHNVSSNNIAVGNGSIELIYLIPKALRAERILIITPTFSEYEFAAIANRAKAVFLKTKETKDFEIELFSLRRFIPKVDMVFLCNPNNPTGRYISGEEVLYLAQQCRRHKTVLVVDEAFGDFVDADNGSILIKNAVKNRNLLVLKSLTKFFALPGLRIGYLVGHCDLVKRILVLQYPWNVNSLAQAAVEEVIRDRDYIDRSRRYVQKERKYLFDNLKRLAGLKVFSSSSNFILCKLEDCAIKSSKTLNEMLIRRSIVVRDCANFRGLGERFFRICVKKREENRRLITNLKELL